MFHTSRSEETMKTKRLKRTRAIAQVGAIACLCRGRSLLTHRKRIRAPHAAARDWASEA